ncbi:MAG: hypothetical protein KKE17_06445 [Proteobacteria bacterium]|nr:hypothetical protein [Pseudomonadota bacterium]
MFSASAAKGKGAAVPVLFHSSFQGIPEQTIKTRVEKKQWQSGDHYPDERVSGPEDEMNDSLIKCCPVFFRVIKQTLEFSKE